MVQAESMGNSRTINKFCGRDPLYQIVHDNTPGLHFPGCGLSPDDCTSLPCCDDALVFIVNLLKICCRDMNSGTVLAIARSVN
jgi:hypothetical protein